MVYNEIKSLPKHIRTTLLKNIEQLAQEGEINIKIDDPTSLEERVANLEAITTNRQERMDSLEQRIDNLEEAFMSVYDYIDKGTPLPKNITDYITKRHMIYIIAHPTKSKVATLRKAILLGSLLLGSLPLLTSSNVEIDTPYRDFTEEPFFIEPASPSIDNITEDGNDILPEENIETIRLYEEIKKAPTVYYKSIYDETQLGVTSQGGIIIRYYLLHEGSCVKVLDTEKELHEFINKQGENIRTFTWKAAICSLDKDKISSYIESLIPVPAEYTTYFIDYIPSLHIDFNHKTPAF